MQASNRSDCACSLLSSIAVAIGLALGPSLIVKVALAEPSGATTLEQTEDRTNKLEVEIESLWDDFNHYVLIARPDLAAAVAQKLLEISDHQMLLDAVEASRFAAPSQTFLRASKMEGVSVVGKDLEHLVESARIERSRDPQRIKANIELLDDGQRPNRNATRRLTAAGQYAAPYLLAALQDKTQTNLHPYIRQAMVEVGRPMVNPLAQALPQLDPVIMGQAAQVLASIGYPQPLASLKQVMETPSTDPTAMKFVQKAYNQLIDRSKLMPNLRAADLYLILGQDYYRAATRGDQIPGFDPGEGKGLVWHYDHRVGLIPIPVPAEIFGDVLAMRAALAALNLDPNLDLALSLFLMANLRRENNLPADEPDPSYSSDLEAPMFYALIAGPGRLHDVLSQALENADATLALDAIEALSTTAGTEALINLGAAQQPLLRALSYPDRRVRFWSAMALAQARPQKTFSGADRVVPVLAEAIRHSNKRYALVLADDGDMLNELLASLNEQGFEAFGARSLAEADEQLNQRPGVDLIAVNLGTSKIKRLLHETQNDYLLGAVPIISVVSSMEHQIRLNELFANQKRLRSVAPSANPQELKSAIEQTLAEHAGAPIDGPEGVRMALQSLDILSDLALGSKVYRVLDAKPALIATLHDGHEPVVTATAAVLARLNAPDAQQALAEAALTSTAEIQIALLNRLAESATHFGAMVGPEQTIRLLELVKNSSGSTAIAAAQAHGALTLPTSNTVEFLVQ